MESYWKLLAEGREAVGEVPADRWNLERYYDAEAGILGKSIASRGGFVESLEQFDPQFFGISPREAPFVDPQHRLLLETAWEAIEDAGLVLDFEKGTDLAVYVGISHNDYQIIQPRRMIPRASASHSYGQRPQHCGQPHFLLSESHWPKCGHGHCVLLRAHCGACCV
ncbi:beta-ketoacyl synthase N-terminal-like domain-containing protein [Verrucomicrobium spinosum]|uniref:beta-ketoacyl synthase N-terminal-like domain-containing protein n=1 Tax=Verrucomicrobium spinosum TaxID=2736 RepID=UPI000AECBCEA|nr:beta-ketoacyl synthase N-terminal-like domain-containing protein [Verrucomicrobium spinosum]